MLGSQSIGDSEGPNSSRATALSHQAPTTHDRTGTIAATMEKHQDAGGIAAGNDRPFPRHATDINRGGLYVLSYRPNRTDIIETLSSLDPSNRSRLGA